MYYTSYNTTQHADLCDCLLGTHSDPHSYSIALLSNYAQTDSDVTCLRFKSAVTRSTLYVLRQKSITTRSTISFLFHVTSIDILQPCIPVAAYVNSLFPSLNFPHSESFSVSGWLSSAPIENEKKTKIARRSRDIVFYFLLPTC